MRANHAKRRLQAGEPSIGTWLSLPSPEAAEYYRRVLSIRPDEPGVDRERNRLLQWLAVGAALMAVIWYFGLLFTLDAQESSLSETLRDAYEDVKAGLGGSAE